jgi:hypothetical protein
MTSEASVRSQRKEPIDVKKHQRDLRGFEMLQVQKVRQLRKKGLTKNHFCDKIIKSSAERLRRSQDLEN